MTTLLHSLLGPFDLRRPWKTVAVLLFAVAGLTILTQVGGLILWLSLPLLTRVSASSRVRRRGKQLLVFGGAYLLCVAVVVPLAAPLNGRVPLPCFASAETPLKPASIGYCLLARNYVRPSMLELLERASRATAQEFPGSEMQYLDANFPFLNRFPLLPHLSHHDGKKVDLAFFYQDSETGQDLSSPPSPIGYWAYEQPTAQETQPCRGTPSLLRWDLDFLQPLFAGAEIDRQRTRRMIQILLGESSVQKMFLEPHLKARLELQSSKIRFQGCRAARHDDHLHVQVD